MIRRYFYCVMKKKVIQCNSFRAILRAFLIENRSIFLTRRIMVQEVPRQRDYRSVSKKDENFEFQPTKLKLKAIKSSPNRAPTPKSTFNLSFESIKISFQVRDRILRSSINSSSSILLDHEFNPFIYKHPQFLYIYLT